MYVYLYVSQRKIYIWKQNEIYPQQISFQHCQTAVRISLELLENVREQFLLTMQLGGLWETGVKSSTLDLFVPCQIVLLTSLL